VSAVLVLLDIRQTLHSSRLLDAASQLNPRLAQALGAITGVIHRRGIGINKFSLGAYQLFSGMVNTQARFLPSSTSSGRCKSLDWQASCCCCLAQVGPL